MINELVVPKPSILIFNDVFYIITFVCPCAHELSQEIDLQISRAVDFFYR